jgi:Xaa-Pro dipeptidase
MPVHFAPEEMASRRDAAAAELSKCGLDALAIFKQESMYYLTGYDTFGFSLFQCLVLTADGATSLLTRLPDLRQAQQTSDITDIRVWHEFESMNPAVDLVSMLDSLGLKGSKIGIELDSYGLKAKAWRALEAELDGFCAWQDESELIDGLRAVKSPAEVAFVRQAAVLADNAWNEAVALAHPGAFEGDILAAMQGAVLKGGGDYAGNEFIIGSGAGALLVRYFTGRRHLDASDQLTLEFAGAYRRYHAAMMRTVLIGTVDAEHRAMHSACAEALAACIETIEPGRPMGDVFDAHSGVMDSAGYRAHRMNACGYGMGAVYNPLWVDPPMFYSGNPLIMSAGNVFFLHMILMNSDSARAMTLGTTVLVTDSGCESLSNSSLELVVNDG